MTRAAPPLVNPANRTTRTVADSWSRRHLLGLQGVGPGELRALLRRADELAAAGGGQSLRGRTVATMFFEDSTRTRTSFTLAARRLGADVVDLSGTSSSVNKGETLLDTARTIHAMGVDAVVIRTRQAGAAALVAGAMDAAVRPPPSCSVINAGDGRHEHPTQGLLDLYTLAQAHGRLDSLDLGGLRVAIVGDVANSRVARSAIAGLTTLGASVVCIGPPSLAPLSLAALGCGGCEVGRDLDAEVPKADAVMMLRIQFERHEEGARPSPDTKPSAAIASPREFHEFYGLTEARAARMKPGAIVMHPGPMNRALEIDSGVADGPRSAVLRQVTNGAPCRMAALEACILA